jgi:hypothetical protein
VPDLYIGKAWNTDMPTLGRGDRVCPVCGIEVYVDRIVAYEDCENWTCPRGACSARVSQKAVNGRYGHKMLPDKAECPDRTRQLSDFKRNNDRQYRTKKWRSENNIE